MLLEGKNDLIAQAQTGTGKTAAFGLPLIELLKPRAGHVQALVLTPTRELAIQVAEEINSLKGDRKLEIVPIYGGQAFSEQLRRLKRGVDIVVGTPGRVIDHINRRTLKVGGISHMILDEADEMLNMGFIEDVETILESTPEEKRVLMFSATIPDRIRHLAERFLRDYKMIAVAKEHPTIDLTDQIYFEVSERDKFEALCRIIDMEPDFYGLVFMRTRVETEAIGNRLINRGYSASFLHGDISQAQRLRILDSFRKKQINILAATDVAARGIDIQDLTHVINFALPQDPESYVHRIGRTGRAGKEGTAITFVTPSEYRKIGFIKRVARTEIRREELPSVKDIIDMKTRRIQNDVEEIIEKEDYKKYIPLADKLLGETDPWTVMASLLKLSFQDELDEGNYNEIRKPAPERHGKARLFIAKGNVDGMTVKELLNLIQSKVRIDSRQIRDIRIYNKFSFVNVPLAEAEKILAAFRKTSKSGKPPLIVKAKPERKK
ncbi:MAG: DEAD/DEAH box helicase, partial [Holophagae bacterium]|nr:DEAD/DEAH box helicase [Holophagae bacterium]